MVENVTLEFDKLQCFETFILALFLVLCMFMSNQGSKKTSNLPPFVKSGFLETFRRFASPDSPFEFIRWERESGPLFRLLLPTGTCFVSTDLSLTKKILSDRDSYKPEKIYKSDTIPDTM